MNHRNRSWIGLLVTALSLCALAIVALPRLHVAACAGLARLSLIDTGQCGVMELSITLSSDLPKLVSISLLRR